MMPSTTHRLQIKDYRLIQMIRESGQLALAAEKLALTQPAASRQLAAIEKTVGSRLFLRNPKGMEPTPVGEVLARNATNLLNGLEQAGRELQAIGSGQAGMARVGAVTGAAIAFVIPAIRRLKKTAIGADIHVAVEPSDRLIEGLQKGEYDFVLSRIPSGTDARQFAIQRGRVEVIRFLVRRDHPLAGRPQLKLADLAGYEWVTQASHTPLRQALEASFLAQSIAMPHEIVNTTSLLVMLAYLTSSDAIAPITREVAELLGPGTFDSSLTALNVLESIVIKPYHVISRRHQYISPLAVQLRELVGTALANYEEGFEGMAEEPMAENPMLLRSSS